MMYADEDLRKRRLQIETEAARWFSRLRNSDKPVDLEDEFREWLDEDPLHAFVYEQCRTAWVLSMELGNDAGVQSEIVRVRNKLDPRFNHTRLSAVIRAWWSNSGLRTATVFILLSGLFYMAMVVQPDEYHTRVGEQRLLMLPDGSTAMLNTDTSLRTEYERHSRRIVLQKGEAYFEVKPDASKPFEVHANDSIVRAVSTEFNVAIQGEAISVTVTKGAVVIEMEDKQTNTPQILAEVELGQAIKYGTDGSLRELASADLERISAWRERKIYFNNDRLIDAINEYNRYSREKIVLQEAAVYEQLITGVFYINDLESFIFALERAFDMVAIRRDGSILLTVQNQEARNDG